MLASVSATRNHRWISAISGSANEDYFPLDETWDRQFKLTGSYRFPRDIYVSTFYQYLDGDPLQRTYIFRSIPRASTVTLQARAVRRHPRARAQHAEPPAGQAVRVREQERQPRRGSVQHAEREQRHVDRRLASGPTYGDINVIVPPRVLRLGATFAF